MLNECNSMEELARANGFESETEYYRLVSGLDLSTFEKILAFKQWQTIDGSKAGLLALMSPVTAASEAGEKGNRL